MNQITARNVFNTPKIVAEENSVVQRHTRNEVIYFTILNKAFSPLHPSDGEIGGKRMVLSTFLGLGGDTHVLTTTTTIFEENEGGDVVLDASVSHGSRLKEVHFRVIFAFQDLQKAKFPSLSPSARTIMI